MISFILYVYTYCIIAQAYPDVYQEQDRQKNFSVIWNAPTQRCSRVWGVNVDVARYGIVTNKRNGWAGSHITIFPTPGHYPRITSNGTIIYGGVPQNTDLSSHHASVKQIVSKTIHHQNFSGLAVLDYEAWRPNWDRNWDSKEIYKNLSRQLVHKEHPDWSKGQIESEAKRRFESGARLFLESTISLCQKLRPKGYWGYYLYPDCYNHKGETTCSLRNKQLDDRIMWLFESTNVLLPSAYLRSPANVTYNKNLVFGMIGESSRIQRTLAERGDTKPLYLYSRFRYKNGEYYTLNDLTDTIGQARSLGADGVILWDDHHLSKSRTACGSLQTYIKEILGPYVKSIL